MIHLYAKIDFIKIRHDNKRIFKTKSYNGGVTFSPTQILIGDNGLFTINEKLPISREFSEIIYNDDNLLLSYSNKTKLELPKFEDFHIEFMQYEKNNSLEDIIKAISGFISKSQDIVHIHCLTNETVVFLNTIFTYDGIKISHILDSKNISFLKQQSIKILNNHKAQGNELMSFMHETRLQIQWNMQDKSISDSVSVFKKIISDLESKDPIFIFNSLMEKWNSVVNETDESHIISVAGVVKDFINRQPNFIKSTFPNIGANELIKYGFSDHVLLHNIFLNEQ